jgi:uncharacterized protein YegL
MDLFKDGDMQTTQVANYSFSGVRPEKLGAPEYTLVTTVLDITGSVTSYAAQLLEMKQAIVRACRKNPRAEFLMLRDVEFNEDVTEVHGFADLNRIDENQYAVPNCRGLTALYDATYAAVAATNEYGRILTEQDFNVNGVVFVVTDGDDNRSVQTPSSIRQELLRGVQNESIESLVVVLIGINAGQFKVALERFQKDAGLQQFVDAGDATPRNLAKLAEFVSRSISSTSQSLGTGGPSQPLTF